MPATPPTQPPPIPEPGDDWRPMVALQHVRPGRPDHVDWMLARDAAGSRPLWSFRAAAVPVPVPGAAIGLRAIADHRGAYLTFEGPVSGNRGTVERLASGRHRVRGRQDAAVELELAWDGEPVRRVRLARADEPHDGPPAEHRGEVAWRLTVP